jgi:hypothetical protein
VVDLGLGPHHEVTAAETRSAFVAFGTEQSANNTPFITHWLTSTTQQLGSRGLQVPSTFTATGAYLKLSIALTLSKRRCVTTLRCLINYSTNEWNKMALSVIDGFMAYPSALLSRPHIYGCRLLVTYLT